MRLVKWFLAVAAGLVVLVVGGTWFYIHVIEGPPPLTLGFEGRDSRASSARAETTTVPSPPSSTDAGSSTLSRLTGRWAATDESQLGYRVNETLFGQATEAVGRTNALTGMLRIDGSAVQEAAFTVDMATVTSDQSLRDNRFRGRIMDVAAHPVAFQPDHPDPSRASLR